MLSLRTKHAFGISRVAIGGRAVLPSLNLYTDVINISDPLKDYTAIACSPHALMKARTQSWRSVRTKRRERLICIRIVNRHRRSIDLRGAAVHIKKCTAAAKSLPVCLGGCPEKAVDIPVKDQVRRIQHMLTCLWSMNGGCLTSF